jgi:2-oxoisovalerate ferredoxin oxidoreductase beta subunit
MSKVIYRKFERHSHGEGIKGMSTHYCPGCGHGLAHKYLANAIEEAGVQERTVTVSPVGCSVFLFYYMDTGNTQAAHGRAPAVAVAHKLANPNAVVVAYQGDGDLGSIGIAEIISAAQQGIPITVIFINNAIYGMTGGQMAPTTLMAQKTSTSPHGRDRLMGEPMKIAELMAQLDGTVYVERVALFNSKERIKAQKAISKAIRLQVEGKGFAFVEVLAECPTHLHISPRETQKWVAEKMVPIFPLGVKKDVEKDPWFSLPAPNFDTQQMSKVIGASSEAEPRYAKGFPSHIAASDIAFKLAGSGGDGAQTAALLLTYAAIVEGFDATHIPSYGPESRGGTSYADVHIAKDEVLSPSAPSPHILIAFNTPSMVKFAPQVVAGGTVVYDSGVIKEIPKLNANVRAYGVPFTEIALSLGKAVVKNIVALGALQAATNLFPPETFLNAVRISLKEKCAMIPVNEEAFQRGVKSCQETGAKK